MADTQVNPAYAGLSRRIAATLAREGIVLLQEFITPVAFARVERTLRTGWHPESVPDRYRMRVHAAHPIQRALATFAARITRAPLIPEGIRAFGHRDYTLLHDEERQRPGVLALLFLDDMEEGAGGEYVLVRDGETIARITPRRNMLLLARRDAHTHSIVLYVNHRAGTRAIRIVSAAARTSSVPRARAH